MKNQRNSSRLGLLAAGITVSSIAMAASGASAIQAARPGSKPAVGKPVVSKPVVGDDRTPVVQLTSTIGDAGFEMFDGKTRRVSLSRLPMDTTDAIVYIDVDSLDLGRKKTQAILDLASDLGWVVMAESSSWNVPRLHAFLAMHYPGVDTNGLQNVAVRIASDKGRAVVTDLTPTDKWRPIVNGVTVRRAVWMRGPEVSFRILGGKFKIQIRGESVSVAARGVGWAMLKGEPDPLGQTGVYATGESADCVADPDVCEPVPMEQTKILFGPLESTDPPPDPTKKSDSRPAAP